MAADGSVDMNEKPILFSGDMVRAILDGRKTQTRRVIKMRNGELAEDEDIPLEITECNLYLGYVMDFSRHYPQWEELRCPYGKPGDLLWVRETWGTVHPHVKPSDFAPNGVRVWYRADDIKKNWFIEKWNPSIFMPRWASRIILRVTDVRVERVQEISEEDARAEGVLKAGGASLSLYTARHHFSQLWDRINAKRGYGWDVNPWVWVVEFRLVD
jgi:hypothetical protein